MGESDLQADNKKNYRKCSEKFDNEVRETSTSIDLLEGLVQSFLKRGEVRDALNAYINAYSSDIPNSACLEIFVDCLSKKARESLSKSKKMCVVYFLCSICHDVVHDPVTLKCGHTFSKKCVLSGTKSDSFECKECGQSYSRAYVSQLKTNVTISAMIDKFWKTQNCDPKMNCQAATPIRMWDSSLYLSVNTQKKILFPDAESRSACFMAYLKKGDLLVNLEKYEEVIKLLLICYTFDPNAVEAKEKAIELLHNLLVKHHSKLLSKNNCFHTVPLRIPFKSNRELPWNNDITYNIGTKYSKHPVDKDGSSRVCENKRKAWGQINSNESIEGNILHHMLDNFSSDIENVADDLILDRIDVTCIEKQDFECALCMRIFWEPVTTPCGHTFCKFCLNRCFDHQPTCPLCKASLANFLADRVQNITEFIELAIKTYLPEEYGERKAMYEEEMDEFYNAGKDPEHVIPLFVCTIAYPTVPCPLHVFEPRYRLMIRQCMESGSCQFGMCAFIDENIAEYGTMLEIRDVQYFSDGRSVVDTVGSRRFRILRRGERDGYNTGAVEFLSDVPPIGVDLEDLKELHDHVYKLSQAWFMRLPRDTKFRILQHFGPMPEVEANYFSSPNGPSWFWWMLAILPIEPRSQIVILSMTSLLHRLKTLYRVVLHLDSSILA